MAERQLTLPSEIVKKSNALARAKWPAGSVWEPRLVALVAARVRREDEDFQEYEIPIQEVVQGKQDGQTYKRVAAVVDNLLGRTMTVQDPKNPKGWTKYALFSKCQYDPEKNILIARFDPDLKPHYLGLKRHFTQFSLMEFLTLPSTYSQRLFEVLRSWTSEAEVTISLFDLQEMLGAPESLRRYPDFRRRVLERAHRDIHAHTSLAYEWSPIKKGRSFLAVRFAFSRPRQKQITAAKQADESRERNELARRAMRCWSRRGRICNDAGRGKMCKICKRLTGRGVES